MRRFLISLVLLAVLLSATAVPAFAHVHTHFLVLPDGSSVEIGPCAGPEAPHDAIHRFHSNVHRGSPGDAFDIDRNPVDLVTGTCN